MKPILTLQNIHKGFFGVPALRDVSVSVNEGRILGLIGENGAGKSTLMNIIGGVVSADSGAMMLMGQNYTPRQPSDATKNGIAFIHQELNLFTNLSIAENIFIDSFPKRRLFIDKAKMQKRVAELLKSVGLNASPDTLVDTLSPGERQLVEIVSALNIDAKLIIFDEPTTSLTARETERLFTLIRRLREEGRSMIYISHILNDIKILSDDIAVLRDGKYVGGGETKDFDIRRMISLMIGRDLEQLYPSSQTTPTTQPILQVKNLSEDGIVHNISFNVHKGEVLGLFGLMGSGRSELARMIFGIDSYFQGEVLLENQKLTKSTKAAIQNKMAFVTENRREEGLMMEATITNNLALVSVDDFARTPLRVVDEPALVTASKEVSSNLRVKASDITRQSAKNLSGGNQQKVVIGKWLMSKPKLFILDEPTRGVDVGAKYEIYSIIHELAKSGNGVLMISSEVEELIGMCDRILVMSQGELVGEFADKSFDREVILRAAFREGQGV
jgi:ribose transport system ATP-binding protein